MVVSLWLGLRAYRSGLAAQEAAGRDHQLIELRAGSISDSLVLWIAASEAPTHRSRCGWLPSGATTQRKTPTSLPNAN
jgi:hypothetical protein